MIVIVLDLQPSVPTLVIGGHDEYGLRVIVDDQDRSGPAVFALVDRRERHEGDLVTRLDVAGCSVQVRFCESRAVRSRPATHLVALCPTQHRAGQARELMVAVLAPLGLELHPAKTSIVHLHRGAQGFEFLGFHHHKVESWRWPGRYYLQRWPSARAMTAVRTKVRDATSVRQVGRSLTSVVADLNPMLRGWGGYFRRGNSARKFSTLDSYVQERLAILDNAKRGRPGRSWGLRHNSSWYARLGVYRLSGTVMPARMHA